MKAVKRTSALSKIKEKLRQAESVIKVQAESIEDLSSDLHNSERTVKALEKDNRELAEQTEDAKKSYRSIIHLHEWHKKTFAAQIEHLTSLLSAVDHAAAKVGSDGASFFVVPAVWK